MKVLYLDLFSGISGDMFIGALLDLGVDFARLERELKKLPLEGYHLHAGRASKSSIAGIKFDVHTADHGGHAHEPEEALSHGHSHLHAHSHGHGAAGSHSHSHEHTHTHPHTHEDPEHKHLHSDPATPAGAIEHSHPHTHVHEHGHRHGSGKHDEHSHAHAHAHEHAPASGDLHEHGHRHEPGHAHAPGGAPDHEHGRKYSQIRELIASSRLSDWVKQKAIAVFNRIAIAEGKIHGVPPDQVAFHEVGAVDSIVDIVGACIALELMGKPRVLAGPVIEGTGWIQCAHGRFPIPAPATLAILGARGIPVSQSEEPNELVTPTGAALLAELVESFGPMHNLVASKVGYGVGTRDNVTRPNVLRAVLGEAPQQTEAHDWETDTVAVLETNLDDINGEVLGHVFEKLFAQGALDVFHTPIHMKKNRPGVLLTVLCGEADADMFSHFILRETTAFGVRRHSAVRRKLSRELITVQTSHGEITVKLGRLDGKVIQVSPEFESCKRAAESSGARVKDVYESALKAIESKKA